MSKTMLITGCSSGLGVALAIDGAKAGYDVFATMRNLEKRSALDAACDAAGVKVEVRRLDVQHPESVAEVVREITAEHGGVDVLINNAGIGFARSTEQADEADITKVFDINLMGVIRCTKAVLPNMRERKTGRVVTVSSVGGLVGQPFNEIYCASKFALEGYVEALACYVGPAFGIHFTVVEPGGIQSEFAATAMKQIEETGGILEDAYQPILGQYLGTVRSRAEDNSPYQTAEEVSAVIMSCVQSDDPPVRCRTSDWGEELCELKTIADPEGRKLRAKVRDMFLGETDN
ncbi:MAG: SDR family oxidoreductase [Pseudomonadota bacterium]